MDAAELAAVAAALCWTFSSLTFGLASREVGAVAVNQFRLFAAVPIMLALHVATFGCLWPQGLEGWRTQWLVLSGLAGLAIGDLGYFYALALVGPRLSSVVQATWPAMAMLMAWGMTGEEPGIRGAVGLALTTFGVVAVVARARDGSSWRPDVTPRMRLLGVLGALVAALGQAGGMAMSRVAMQEGPDLPEGLPPLSATVVRLLAGTLGVVVISLLQRQAGSFRVLLRGGPPMRNTLVGTLFGPVVGIFLSMYATRHASHAGVAAALMSLTPLFLLPVSWIAYRARVTPMAVVGTLLATAGAIVLVSGR
jgi:drug/metabolite transporter (DMT)-like permease